MKYPDVHVNMIGEDGNAFAILGRAIKALRRVGVPAEEIAQFTKEATSGDYNHLLRVVMEWMHCD